MLVVRLEAGVEAGEVLKEFRVSAEIAGQFKPGATVPVTLFAAGGTIGKVWLWAMPINTIGGTGDRLLNLQGAAAANWTGALAAADAEVKKARAELAALLRPAQGATAEALTAARTAVTVAEHATSLARSTFVKSEAV